MNTEKVKSETKRDNTYPKRNLEAKGAVAAAETAAVEATTEAGEKDDEWRLCLD